MIAVKNLHKAYGEIKALDDVSFEVKPGEIVGLLGPNGAGKTTLIKILTGYMHPDAGSVMIDGLDVQENTLVVQSRLGYLPENAPVYPELTVQSYLKMIANLRGIPPGEQLRLISLAVHAIGLEGTLNRPIGQLSKGFRQRVGIAQAILHQPRLLILDEPTVGLDPTQIVQIRGLIKQLARQSWGAESQHTTVLFSTHILPEVEALCDRAIILMRGEIKADAYLQELAQATATILVLSPDHLAWKPEEAKGALEAVQSVQDVQAFLTARGLYAFRIRGESPDISQDVFKLASENGWPVREIKQEVRTLETVFNELALAE